LISLVCGIDHTTVANDGCAPQKKQRPAGLHVAIPPHKYKTAIRTARPLVT
jgi:hypothetical protein